jgi:hypothetical protein
MNLFNRFDRNEFKLFKEKSSKTEIEKLLEKFQETTTPIETTTMIQTTTPIETTTSIQTSTDKIIEINSVDDFINEFITKLDRLNNNVYGNKDIKTIMYINTDLDFTNVNNSFMSSSTTDENGNINFISNDCNELINTVITTRGDYKTISNLNPINEIAALFMTINYQSEISNLIFDNMGRSLCFMNNGKINNCKFENININQIDRVSSIVSTMNYGTISNSSFYNIIIKQIDTVIQLNCSIVCSLNDKRIDENNNELNGLIENCVFSSINLDVINGATICYTNKSIIRQCTFKNIIMVASMDKVDQNGSIYSEYNSGGIVCTSEGGSIENIFINGMIILNGNNKGLLMINFKKSNDNKLNNVSCIKIDEKNNVYNLFSVSSNNEYNNIEDIENINNIFYMNNSNYILVNTIQINNKTENNILNINNDNYNSCNFYSV